jgi:hypothetical protein
MTDVAVAPGEDLVLNIPVVDDSGNPRDVTGASGEFPIFAAPLSPSVLFGGSMAITDAVNGLVAFTLAGSDTGSFRNEYHVLYYETWLVDSGGARTRLGSGKLTLA